MWCIENKKNRYLLSFDDAVSLPFSFYPFLTSFSEAMTISRLHLYRYANLTIMLTVERIEIFTFENLYFSQQTENHNNNNNGGEPALIHVESFSFSLYVSIHRYLILRFVFFPSARSLCNSKATRIKELEIIAWTIFAHSAFRRMIMWSTKLN